MLEKLPIKENGHVIFIENVYGIRLLAVVTIKGVLRGTLSRKSFYVAL